MATGAMVAVAMPVFSSSEAAVGPPRSIEVQTGSNLVLLEGYPKGARVTIRAFRKGTVIGFATKRVDSSGTIELNHGGRAAGDCFESPNTPDLKPGDSIRTRIHSNGVRDSSIVRGVRLKDVVAGETSITASGKVQLEGRTAVNPARDVLELRVRTAGDDIREEIGPDVQADGTWTHEIAVPEGAADSEVVLEWSKQSARELTVAQFGVTETLAAGCPPLR